MNVVLLSATGAPGGAERVLLDLLASLRRARPQWRLALVSGGGGPLLAEAALLGVAVHPLPFPAAVAALGDAAFSGSARPGAGFRALARTASALPALVAYRARLRRLLRGLSPDVVHTHGFKVHALAAAALPPGAALVWHLHDFLSRRRVMGAAMRALAPRCAAAVAVSRAVAADARAVCGPRLRVETVYNAVDLDRFAPEGPVADLDALAELPPAPPGTVRVGLVATMGRWKGHELFLRALASLPREAPVRGYVVGGAIYATAGSETPLAEVREMAERLGIADRVGFTGFVDEPAAAVRALDVVVHASTQPEPFGRVIAEAMACARPVVVSAAGGAAELVRPGEDALTFPPGEADGLAFALRRLVDDPGLRAALGAEGRRTAEARFDRARLAEEMVPVYESVAGPGT